MAQADRLIRTTCKQAGHFPARLCDQQSLAFVLHYRGDATPFKVKGNPIQFAKGMNVRMVMFHDSGIEGIDSLALRYRLTLNCLIEGITPPVSCKLFS
jgi:hypothetical protein